MNTQHQVENPELTLARTGCVYSMRLLSTLMAGLFLWWVPDRRLAAVENTGTPPAAVSGALVLYQPFMWAGEIPPSEAENQLLLAAVQNLKEHGLEAALPALEQFIAQHPNSPWVPSLRANLGGAYQARGLSTRALQQWEAAWNATRSEKDGPAKKVADFTFAHWTGLLANLGRADALGPLLEQTQGRIFDGGPLQQIINRSKQAYNTMRNAPNVSFRCGTLALNQVGRALKGPAFDGRKITQVPAPASGFSLTRLAELARENGLDLVPVAWGQDKALVAPSLIHFKQNHYAAIIEQKEGDFLVADPTFGRPRWLKGADIQEEASGEFLVPREKLPPDWRVLTAAETDQIVGRGYVLLIWDEVDGCGNVSISYELLGPNGDIVASGSGSLSSDDTGSGSASGSGGNGTGQNAGGGGSGAGVGAGCSQGSCGGGGGASGSTGGSGKGCGCPGMPIWEVSEPFINVWLYDEPIGYTDGLGNRISFKLSYKQRETQVYNSTVFTPGNMWNCSWLSYVVDGTSTPFDLDEPFNMLAPGGGMRYYHYPFNSVITNLNQEYFSNTTMQRTTNSANALTGFVLCYANGAKDYYQFVPTNVFSSVAFLSAKADPFGRTTMQFVYEHITTPYSLVRLDYVIDGDGQTNTLTYSNTNDQSLITGVQDPFGHSVVLQYDDRRNLTNIIDAASLTNSFQYNNGWLTALTTPYGTTTFQYIDNGSTDDDQQIPVNDQDTPADPYDPIRAVRVVDAAGGTNIYMLRQDSSEVYVAQGTLAGFMPGSSNDGAYEDAVLPVLPISGIHWDNEDLYYRDSFHWGPKQASGLTTTNMYYFTPSDYLNARMRHWLHGSDEDDSIIGTLGLEQEPSVDGATKGQTTWYLYDGQSGSIVGTESKPAWIGRVVPDEVSRHTWYKWFRRDQWGRATNVVENYFNVTDDNNSLPRTNVFVYGANEVDLVAHIGPLGETLAGYAYTNHNVSRMTNAVGDVTYYTYDAQWRLTSTKSTAGLTTTNLYFQSTQYTNWLQTAIDLEIGRANSYTYTNDLVWTQTDERGTTTTNTWDALGRLTSSSDARGTNLYIYSKLDQVETVDRMGYSNSFVYDPLRRKVAETNALGFYTLYNYCSCGALDFILDAGSNYTWFFYDNLGRITNAVYADGYSVTNQYDLMSRLISVTDSAAYSVTNSYNIQNLKYAANNAFGLASALILDVEDRVTNSVDANGVTNSMTYDNLGRLQTLTHPDNGVEKFDYSARGLVTYWNQLGLPMYYMYDEAGRKTSETDADGQITQFQYDPSGNLTNLIDGLSHNTAWNYDPYGRVANKVDAAGNTLFVYNYDPDNRVTSRTNATGRATVYRYDPVGNLTNVVYPVSTNITLQYDSLNRLTNMVDAVGTTKFAYDAAGQLLNEDGPWGDDAVSYTYANRLRTGLSLQQPTASAWAQSYAYDAANRLTNITSQAGAFAYAYDATRNLQVARLALPGGAYVTNTYDSVARLTGTYLQNSGHTNLNAHGYIYNPGNQRTNQTRILLVSTNGTVRLVTNSVVYTYDNIGQLQTASGKEANSSLRLQEQLGYAYDAGGNLNWRTNNALTNQFQVNNLNELTTVGHNGTLTVAGTTGSQATNVTVNGLTAILYADSTFARTNLSLTSGSNTFTAVAQDSYGRVDTNSVTVFLPSSASYYYDLNGNLTNDGNRVFFYDEENQLTTVLVSNAWASVFVYDGKMRRRERIECAWEGGGWITNSTVRYVYDGNLVIQERDGNNLPLVTYTRGKDLSGTLQGAGGIGGLLARTDMPSTLNPQPSASPHAYYHADGNGNITALVNSNQLLVARYEYDPYGNMLAMSGPLADANLYRFSGKEFHPNSGLVYYLYRFYDPNLQRWLNRDPIAEKGGLNLYGFVQNNPLSHSDPLGLDDCAKCFDNYAKDMDQTQQWAVTSIEYGYGFSTVRAIAVGFQFSYFWWSSVGTGDWAFLKEWAALARLAGCLDGCVDLRDYNQFCEKRFRHNYRTLPGPYQ